MVESESFQIGMSSPTVESCSCNFASTFRQCPNTVHPLDPDLLVSCLLTERERKKKVPLSLSNREEKPVVRQENILTLMFYDVLCGCIHSTSNSEPKPKKEHGEWGCWTSPHRLLDHFGIKVANHLRTFESNYNKYPERH
jgi:hypothetical protein